MDDQGTFLSPEPFPLLNVLKCWGCCSSQQRYWDDQGCTIVDYVPKSSVMCPWRTENRAPAVRKKLGDLLSTGVLLKCNVELYCILVPPAVIAINRCCAVSFTMNHT